MRRIAGPTIVFLCLALLLHDGASARFRTFRPLQDERYVPAFLAALQTRRSLAQMCRLLRMMGTGTDGSGWDNIPWYFAAMHGREDIARFLIRRGADANERGKWGWTPLHSAARNGHASVARFLMAHGADANARTEANRTPLDVATAADMKVLLRSHGAKTAKELDAEAAK